VDRIRPIGNLADLDGPNVRQAQNAVELQLQLVLIEIPEAFADAAEIAPADFIDSSPSLLPVRKRRNGIFQAQQKLSLSLRQ